jgi:integrase
MTVYREKSGFYEGQWTFKFKKDGKQFTKRGFKTRKKALDAENERKKEVGVEIEKERAADPTSMKFSEISGEYLAYCKGRFQKNTWRQKGYVYRSFIVYLEEDPEVESLIKKNFLDFLAHHKDESGPKTANRYLKDLHAMFNWGVRNDFLAYNPAKGIEPYPEERYVKYIPPFEDFLRAVLVATPEEQDILWLMFLTAGRRGEIIERLTWEDINFEAGVIRLWTMKRKGGLKPRLVPMSQRARDILTRRWENRDKRCSYVFVSPVTKDQYSDQAKKTLMKRLCKEAGIDPPFTFHGIRHLAASKVMDSGKATVKQIQNFLGHLRLTTTDTYIHDLRVDQGVGDILDSFADDTGENGENGENGEGVTTREDVKK